MKKILFASTALVATAGIAAAEISFSGEAGIGMTFVDGRTEVVTTESVDPVTGVVSRTTEVVDADDWQLDHYATLSVSMTGETDGGLSFGADFDITTDADGNGSVDSSSAYIEGGFGKFSAGDVDTASQSVTGLSDIGYAGLGVDNVAEVMRGGDDDYQYDGIPASMLYEGTFGDFKAALSYDLEAETLSVGGKYTVGDYSFAVGYDDYSDTIVDTGVVHVQVGANISDFSINALYSTTTDNDVLDLTSYGITAGYTMGATTVTAAYSKAELDAGPASREVDAFGIGVAYDLGGGASINAGVGEVDGVTVADMGIIMTF